MSRIGTNYDALVALHNLERVSHRVTVSMRRLSTGLRIVSGKDDPGGLVTGEMVRQEVAQIDSALQNNYRSNSLVGTADAALGEIGGLLAQLQGLVTTMANDATLSSTEKEAIQNQADSILGSIDLIANNTRFGSKKLLDGSLGYRTEGLVYGTGSIGIADVQIHRAPLQLPFTVDVLFAANGTITVALVPPGALPFDDPSATTSTLLLEGSEGVATITLDTSSGLVDTGALAGAVNSVSQLTGVTALDVGVLALVTRKGPFGSEQRLSLTHVGGDNVLPGAVTNITEYSSDATVFINGQRAQTFGNRATLRTDTLDIEITFGRLTGFDAQTFQIVGGGTEFLVSGEVNSGSRVSLGIPSMHTGSLGGVVEIFTPPPPPFPPVPPLSTLLGADERQSLSSLRTGGQNELLEPDNLEVAAEVVRMAIADVSGVRARLGSFSRFTLEKQIGSLQVAKENLLSARSVIVDADYAVEVASVVRNLIVAQAGIGALGISNARPMAALQLLGGSPVAAGRAP